MRPPPHAFGLERLGRTHAATQSREETMKQIYADFNDIAADGTLPLTCAGSVESISELEEGLKDGEEVWFTDGELLAKGRVFRRADATWEGKSDWSFQGRSSTKMTNARRMSGDLWKGVQLNEWTVPSAGAEDLERALERLDAVAYTMITIDAADDHCLTVGGGAGKYVVVVTFDNQAFFTLLRRDPAAGIVMLNVGGQEGDYPAEQVVGVSQALQAARVFLATGGLDETQEWVRSGQSDP